MGFLQGIATSNGIAIAKAYKLVEPDFSFEKRPSMRLLKKSPVFSQHFRQQKLSWKKSVTMLELL